MMSVVKKGVCTECFGFKLAVCIFRVCSTCDRVYPNKCHISLSNFNYLATEEHDFEELLKTNELVHNFIVIGQCKHISRSEFENHWFQFPLKAFLTRDRKLRTPGHYNC